MGVQDAQEKLAKGLAVLQTEIEAEVKKVPAAAVVNLFLKRLNSQELSEATHNVRDLIAAKLNLSCKLLILNR